MIAPDGKMTRTPTRNQIPDVTTVPIGKGPRAAMGIGRRRDAISIGLLRGGMAIGLPRAAMLIGLPRVGMAIDRRRDAISIGLLRAGMAIGRVMQQTAGQETGRIPNLVPLHPERGGPDQGDRPPRPAGMTAGRRNAGAPLRVLATAGLDVIGVRGPAVTRIAGALGFRTVGARTGGTLDVVGLADTIAAMVLPAGKIAAGVVRTGSDGMGEGEGGRPSAIVVLPGVVPVDLDRRTATGARPTDSAAGGQGDLGRLLVSGAGERKHATIVVDQAPTASIGGRDLATRDGDPGLVPRTAGQGRGRSNDQTRVMNSRAGPILRPRTWSSGWIGWPVNWRNSERTFGSPISRDGPEIRGLMM
jgi:hypothetical protein